MILHSQRSIKLIAHDWLSILIDDHLKDREILRPSSCYTTLSFFYLNRSRAAINSVLLCFVRQQIVSVVKRAIDACFRQPQTIEDECHYRNDCPLEWDRRAPFLALLIVIIFCVIALFRVHSRDLVVLLFERAITLPRLCQLIVLRRPLAPT